MDDKISQDIITPQAATPPPRKQTPMILKIFYTIFGIVCLFGVVKITLQTLFPVKPNQIKAINVTSNKVNWKLYTNKKFNYSITFPDYLKKTETKYSTVFGGENNQYGAPGFPSLYISVIPDNYSSNKEIYNFMSGDIVNKFYSLKDNESLQTESGPDADYWTFKKLSSFMVSSSAAVMIQNNNVWQGEGVINRRIVIKKPGIIYIIGSYYKTQPELDNFRKFLMSFKLL